MCDNAKITKQKSGLISSKRDSFEKNVVFAQSVFPLCSDKQSVVSTFKHMSSGSHSHTHSHSLTHTHIHSPAQPVTHAMWCLNDGLAASDQPPPLLVVLQVEGPAGCAVLHWQRVGAYGQRLCLCIGNLKVNLNVKIVNFKQIF